MFERKINDELKLLMGEIPIKVESMVPLGLSLEFGKNKNDVVYFSFLRMCASELEA